MQKFLNARLFEVGDNDERVAWIEAASEDLTGELKKRPRDIPRYTLVALDPNVPSGDPVLDRVETLLSKRWKNLIGHYGGRPTVLLRAVIGDSLWALARTRRFGACIALTAYGASTYVDSGNEAEAWAGVLSRAQAKLDAGTKAYWGDLTELSSVAEVASCKVASVDQLLLKKWVRAGLRTGVEEGLQPNPHPFGTDPWADHAADRIARGVGKTVDDALLGTFQSDDVSAVSAAVQELQAAVRGVTARSEILWWRQARFSELLDSGYSDLAPELAVIVMSSDFFALSLPYPPRSAQAFLAHAIGEQVGEGKTTLKKLINAVRKSDLVDLIDGALGRSHGGTGRVPLLEYLRQKLRDSGSPVTDTVLGANEEVPLAHVGAWLFSDFAAEQLATKVEP